jgi:hypothetical protein
MTHTQCHTSREYHKQDFLPLEQVVTTYLKPNQIQRLGLGFAETQQQTGICHVIVPRSELYSFIDITQFSLETMNLEIKVQFLTVKCEAWCLTQSKKTY